MSQSIDIVRERQSGERRLTTKICKGHNLVPVLHAAHHVHCGVLTAAHKSDGLHTVDRYREQKEKAHGQQRVAYFSETDSLLNYSNNFATRCSTASQAEE